MTATNMQNPVDAAILRVIAVASEQVTRTFRRRFDERFETRRYTAVYQRDGGDLIDASDLQLDDDLKTVSRIAIQIDNAGSERVIAAYKLLPTNLTLGGVAVKKIIHLNTNGSDYWTSYGADPVEAIGVTGTWGYGGQWVGVAALLAVGLSNSANTLILFAVTEFEIGMVIRLSSEYLYVSAINVALNQLTCVRGFNGSVAAAHTTSEPIAYFLALDTVRDLVLRLTQWKLEQAKSPLAQSIGIGDTQSAISTEGIPSDFYLSGRDLSLSREELWRGV